MEIMKEYERWLANATADTDVAVELRILDDSKSKMLFIVILPLAQVDCGV